ncbi:hypothetical protein F9K79_13305 [Ochrobactrum sp. Kaboul]|nr:hypothetical protein F9K79_13305 [Ochrobactrum sp. Kaboul]
MALQWRIDHWDIAGALGWDVSGWAVPKAWHQRRDALQVVFEVWRLRRAKVQRLRSLAYDNVKLNGLLVGMVRDVSTLKEILKNSETWL